MNDFDDFDDRFDHYEEVFDPIYNDRQARRKRKPKVKHIPKKETREVVAELADEADINTGFKTTYKPARYEADWLLESLRSFYEADLITDVLAVVKGGKEASVYRCAAHPGLKTNFLAAKVYRPRRFRNLRNDKMYREGRELLTTEGRPAQERDQRLKRALYKGTTFGSHAKHTSWLMYEYTTLEKLFRDGGNVPAPLAVSDNAILMAYIGDNAGGAPALNEIDLPVDEATELLQVVIDNLHLMLRHNMIHGDLSAYNILYWDGELTIIDFPQAVNSRNNPHAADILQRDITRTCQYFQRQGVDCDASAIFNQLWEAYMAKDPALAKADASRLLIPA